MTEKDIKKAINDMKDLAMDIAEEDAALLCELAKH